MQLIRSIPEMKAASKKIREKGLQIGFVPTMGYLHEGHLSLVDIAKENSDFVVMSIFVNPTQFAPHEDFERYPRDIERDEHLAEERGVDLIFYPRKNEMYPEGYHTYVKVEELSSVLCGAFRPIHFKGVTTVCTKLFNIVKPHVAVFGQKDAQQAIIIKKMVEDLNMDVEILVGPTVREEDGLAMSSRNVYLTPEERKQATVLYRSLQHARNLYDRGIVDARKVRKEIEKMIKEQPAARIDYVEIVSTRDLQPVEVISRGTLIALAVHFGKARLIDNIIIE